MRNVLFEVPASQHHGPFLVVVRCPTVPEAEQAAGWQLQMILGKPVVFPQGAELEIISPPPRL